MLLFLCLSVSFCVQVNRTVENIGARRLHTIVERVIEDLSFAAPERPGESVLIDAAYVRSRVSDMLKTSDLRKYIL
jgi:ATP-dependent HslUV protease ATP-binding subunit HslU